jgi:hypothetical protein
MRVVNTSTGPVAVSPDPPRHINTSRVTEEDLTYTDEPPEILSVMPAGDWHAVVEGEPVPLIAFVALDDGKLYGVAVGPAGRVDLTEGNVETYAGFSGYVQTNNEPKENQHG